MPRPASWSPRVGRESYDDPYPTLREVLSPELADLPPEHIERIMHARFGSETAAQDLESFWSSLRDFGRAAAPVLTAALPIIGSVAGTVIGGPIGAKVGGAAGSALSGALGGALSGPSRGAGRRALSGFASGALSGLGGALGGGASAGGPGGIGGLAGAIGGGAPPPGLGGLAGIAGRVLPALAGGGGSPAAGQLLNLLQRPEVGQALLAMTLGGAGRRQVPVGDTPVPVGAIANLLGVLANQAAAEHHQTIAGEAAGTPLYLLDDAGEFMGDPADPVHRAEVLLGRFAQAEAVEAARAAEDTEASYDEAQSDENAEWEQEALEDLYDEMDLAFALAGEEEN